MDFEEAVAIYGEAAKRKLDGSRQASLLMNLISRKLIQLVMKSDGTSMSRFRDRFNEMISGALL